MASLAIQDSLSAKDSEDIRSFIEGFSGMHHYIMDYLERANLFLIPLDE